MTETLDIVVVPPDRRTIFGMNVNYSVGSDGYDYDTERVEKFFLPFPYIIFVYRQTYDCGGFIGKCLFIGFANEEPNEKTTVYFPPIPNVYKGWYVCLAEAIGLDNVEDIDSAIGYFWRSHFDLRCQPQYTVEDLGMPGVVMIKQTPMESLRGWEKLSPEEVLKIEWQTDPKYRKTFAEFQNYTLAHLRV